MRSLLQSTPRFAVVVLVAAWLVTPRVSGDETWRDRWLHNSRQKTLEGAAALERGDTAAALKAFADAARLDNEPALKYNLGTAHLLAGELGAEASETARAALEDASRVHRLAPRAFYNLGNLFLESGHLEEAVNAYIETLRRAPDLEDAKLNLEIALRRLEEQSPDEPENNEDGEEGDQGSPPPPQPQPDPNEDSGEGEEEDQQEPAPGAQRGEEESPLPQFQDLPDMTAEEAAAILEAVENLEREERREQALEALRSRPEGAKDW